MLLPWGFNWLMPTQGVEFSMYLKHFLSSGNSAQRVV